MYLSHIPSHVIAKMSTKRTENEGMTSMTIQTNICLILDRQNSLSTDQILSALPPTSDGMATPLETPLMVLAAGMVGMVAPDHLWQAGSLAFCLLSRYDRLHLKNTIFQQMETHAALFSA